MKVLPPGHSNQPVDILGEALLTEPDAPRRHSPAETLVARCVAGDDDAWREMHRAYLPVAASFLRKLGVKECHLEDACQEVFVTMFRFLPSFRGEADLKTWLYRLCATEAGKVRQRSKLWNGLISLWALQAPQTTVGLEWSEDLALQKARRALERLGPKERLVFVLFEMEGVRGEQIAEIVECPVATVWRQLHYARKTFVEALAQQADGGGT